MFSSTIASTDVFNTERTADAGTTASHTSDLPRPAIQLIADALADELPGAAEARNRVLTAVLHPDPLDHANQPTDDDGICGWGVLPLTLVVGTRDRAIPPEVSARVAGMVRDARVETLAGLGHLAHEEAPERVARVMTTAFADPIETHDLAAG